MSLAASLSLACCFLWAVNSSANNTLVEPSVNKSPKGLTADILLQRIVLSMMMGSYVTSCNTMVRKIFSKPCTKGPDLSLSMQTERAEMRDALRHMQTSVVKGSGTTH